MSFNTFGKIFRVTIFGESHGKAMGGVIDGCPAGVSLDMKTIQAELDRRKPGQSKIVTQRKEPDTVEFLSGIFDGKTTGTPIGFIVPNQDQKSKDYDHIKDVYRPSHADYTYDAKYGIRDYRGGGRSSARETVCRVVAGAIAKQILKEKGIEIQSYVSQVGSVKLEKNHTDIDLSKIDSNDVRCPDDAVAEQMIECIKSVKKGGDTIGGVITGVIQGVSAGIGAPVFAKLHADLGQAMLSINAVKGFEYGSGFAGVEMKGSEHNDAFESIGGKIASKTNHSGGVQGGISNGADIYFRVAFKPVATIMTDQDSVDSKGEQASVAGKGRHDACVVPRAVPIVDSMAAMTILDHILLHQTTKLKS